MAGILPLAVLFFLKKKFNLEIIIYLSLSFLTALIIIYTREHKINNLVFFNIYHAIAILCLTIYYYRTIKGKFLRILILILAIITYSIFIWEITQTPYIEYTLIAEFVIFILFSLIFYFNTLINFTESTELLNSQLIFNSAIFFYNVFSIVLIVYITLIMINKLWFIHNFIEGSSKLLIAYALWKLPKTAHS